MPTVASFGPYRLFFYSADRAEPIHVHVERQDKVAKFWLDPVRLARSGGFSRHELGRIEALLRDHEAELIEAWNEISALELRLPAAEHVLITEDTLSVELSDGRTISAPLAWYPRLLHGTSRERRDWRLVGRGQGIHWESLDEDISVEGLLAGRASAESQASFKKWLQTRKAAARRRSRAQLRRR